MKTSSQAIYDTVLRAEHSISITKSLLTAHQAREIYRLKPEPFKPSTSPRGQSQSRVLAQRYGMSPKAIRDIWNGRTWIHATAHSSISSEGSTSHEVFGPLCKFWRLRTAPSTQKQISIFRCLIRIFQILKVEARNMDTLCRPFVRSEAVPRDPRTRCRAFATSMSPSALPQAPYHPR